MAGEVLRSGTDYTWSLAANIRCFYNAVKTEKELSLCKRGLSDHEKRLAALEKNQDVEKVPIKRKAT